MSIKAFLSLRNHAVNDLKNTMHELFSRTDFYRSCLSCSHFDTETEICGLNQKHPPAIIIANGCECYDDSGEIPF